MAKIRKVKDGVYITRTNRGHFGWSWTVQGEPIPNNFRRRGTKRLAGGGGGKSRGKHGGNGGVARKDALATLRKREELGIRT